MNREILEKLEAYEVVRVEDLPDIHAEGIELRHKKSGARVALIPCSDTNKVFGIGFRTPPADSTGVAHIIEHTVLCGSEHFPLKDPFVELIKGSLNTFLNAMTYPDKTIYPVASTNDADFHNLMHVYLDAVFFPNIYHEQNIFRQEGWHYEMETEESPLTMSGVVYSEMKGVFSSPDDVLERETMNALFPDTAYGVESGGDPDVIPELTYEAYLDFHRRYYHPSNSYIFLYGDMNLTESLKFLDEEYLGKFDRLEVDSVLRFQKPFAEERRVVKEYPVSGEEESAGNDYLSWNVVAGDCLDMKELLALEILDYALLSKPGAPVRQALIDAGIGSDVYGGFSDGILQPYFSVTAKQAEEVDADRFRQIIRETLEAQVKEGISRESLKAGLHSLEFTFREADYGLAPKGLYYYLDCLNTWLYSEEHPFGGLKQLDAFQDLKSLMDTDYFEKLVEEKFLRNPHSAFVILKAKAGLQEEREKRVAEALEKKKSGMSPEEIREVVEQSRALLAWQDSEETKEALASLPMLKRSDLRREILPLSNVEKTETVTFPDGSSVTVPVVCHETECNGIGYLELLFNARRVEAELLPYLGLLRSVLLNVDTESYTYTELSNAVNAKTGGIGVSLSAMEAAKEEEPYKAFFAVRMKALLPEMVEGGALIREILYTSRFDDEKRIRELLSQYRAQMEAQLMQAGNVFASGRAAAYISSDAVFTDQVSGIAYYRFLKSLEENYEEKKGEIRENLVRLSAQLFRADNLLAGCTCKAEDWEVIRPVLAASLSSTDRSAALLPELETKPYGILNEGFTTSGQVQYVAVSGSFADSGVPYTGAMGVLRQILNFDYLWQNIRVRGNAYGCSSLFKRNGRGSLVSFRDPHLARTKETFDGTAEYVRSFRADEETMTKYVIGTVSGMDTPLTPSTFGAVSMRAYLTGLTEDMRQTYRDEVIDASEEDIRATAEALKSIAETGAFCVIGGESAIKKHEGLFLRVEALL